MVILGLNAFNPDAAAVLLVDGKVVAAVEEERLSRVRHAGGFPSGAIRACLEIGGISIGDVEHVAFARRPERNMGGGILYALAGRSSYTPELRAALEEAAQPIDWHALFAGALNIAEDKLRFDVHAVEHQLAHAASAFYASPFNEAAILTVDTVGDFCSTMLARGRGAEIEVLERVLFPHSLGLFYGMVSQLLGFEAVGDESKTMGLAAFGSDRFLDDMRKIVRPGKSGAFELDLDYFSHNADGEPVRLVESAPRVATLYSEQAIRRFGPPRRRGEPVGERERDLAFAVQRVLEERVVETATRLRRLSRCEHLVYAGQVAMNCVANRALRRAGLFRSIGVAPAAVDSGTALGAALHAAIGLGCPREKIAAEGERVDLGPGFGEARAAAALEARGIPFRKPAAADRIAETAAALDGGDLVGWFEGRMEFGPRALGFRSVLADPRRASSVERLRRTLSHRETYRSFGASVPLESAAQLFENPAPSPAMLDAFKANPAAAQKAPAVVHADGTTRLHTVVREANPAYYDLLVAFGARTGLPLLLNTSFNADEPLVCTPEEAIACALRARLDRLVVDGLVAELPRDASTADPDREPVGVGHGHGHGS